MNTILKVLTLTIEIKCFLIKGPPPKKRRRIENHKSCIKKQLVEHGEEHQTKTKTIQAKTFIPQEICQCAKRAKKESKCSAKIDIQRQKDIFDSYYKGMIWSQKALFLRGNIQRQPVKSKKNRQISRSLL